MTGLGDSVGLSASPEDEKTLGFAVARTQRTKRQGGGVMHHNSPRMAAIGLILSAGLLSACSGGEKKDEMMAEIFTDCQMRAHTALEDSTLKEEQKHFALGQFVERCLKENGLQPSDAEDCFEAPPSEEGGKGFVKPTQQCWKNPRAKG